MKKFLLYVAIILLLTAGMAAAADEPKLEIGGDYRFKYDMLKGTVHDYISQAPGNPAVPSYKVWNNWLMLDYLALTLKADVAEDLTVKARLDMYKVWGHQTMQPVQGKNGQPIDPGYFADRSVGPFDGTVSHVPTDSLLRVDEAYATLSNIGGAPVWFSAGRRPSTGGVPTNLRKDYDKIGTAGVPGIMIDYAFDGVTLGYSPEIKSLPGAYAKLCYGKGFDSGFNDQATNTLKDTDFVGLNIVPYDSTNLQINLEVQKGFHLGDQPSDTAYPPNTNQHSIELAAPVVHPTTNVGDVTWWGGVVMGKVSDLNLFASAAQSRTSPKGELNAAGAGLLWDSFHDKANRTGTAVYVGGRYDINSIGVKIGAEYNQGSKYWVGMVPAGDDIWTSKLGARGEVYEVYLIKELMNRPLMKNAKAFWRFGYQLYKFDYTGSNNWMGAPIKMSNLNLTNAAMAQNLVPLEKATDLYMVFEVLF